MPGLRGLFREIHRRSLWQVLGTYLAGAWIALQVVEVLMGTIGLPDWVPVLTIGIFLAGIPVVLATAFVQEGIGRLGRSRATAAATDIGLGEERVPRVSRGEAAAGERPGNGADVMEVAAGAPGRNRVRHRLFTWRNALVAGVVAFALLGAATLGFMLMRTLGIGPAGTLVAKGVLEERAPVVLADFESAAGDGLLARAATEAFRVDLSQSKVVRLVEASVVSEALARMQRPADAELDLVLARELAVREGIPAVIGGEITPVGRGFVLTATLVSATDRETLASQRASASDSSAIIPAIDELSKKLRERIGESLKSIRSDDPLERVTTASLPALRRYSQAVRAIEVEGDQDRGIALLEEAVALDSTFAMAFRKLGVALSNRGVQRERQVEALGAAYRHRDRLTERERYLTVGSYLMTAANDLPGAVAAYESLLELDPEEDRALNNLGVIYSRLGESARAEEYFRRSIEADSSDLLPYGNAAAEQISQGKLAEARATLEAGIQRSPNYLALRNYRAGLYAVERDWERAADEYAALGAERPENPFWTANAHLGQGAVAATRGRLREAEAHYERVTSGFEAAGVVNQAFFVIMNLAQMDLYLRGDTAAAKRRLEAALERRPLEEISPLERPYLMVGTMYAVTGDLGRARAMLAAYERDTPTEQRDVLGETLRHALLGGIAFAEGRHDEAIAEYRRSTGGCRICNLPGLSLVYEARGQQDSALAIYQRYLETPWAFRLNIDQLFLARAYERLGELYDARDDREKAKLYYALFTELWADADPELQPRVQAAQARLEELVRLEG